MCGIFGYVGPRANEKLLVNGLRRLEYRGYDSWGICLGGNSSLHIYREAGRITNAALSNQIKPAALCSGIAHTRWATHGPPTVTNAHPHTDCDEKLAVVHNGIIENYVSLQEKLCAQGHRFTSEVDSEVIPHLIEQFMRDDLDFRSAFLNAMRVIEGTFGIAVVWAGDPTRILVARKGSPMVIGGGENEMMGARDPAALIAHTRRVIYLDDGEAAAINAEMFETFDLDAVPISKEVENITYDLPAIERDGFPHFMLKEIFEQPTSIMDAMRGRIVRHQATAKLGGISDEILRKTERCHIIACGTSWHAGLVGKYLLENLSRLPTQVSYAAEFRYANPVIEPNTLIIAISQSGETADTLGGVREGILHGAPTIGICNVVGSTIARECGAGVYLHAGPEIGVASTKAFTSQLIVLTILALHLGRMRNMSLRDALIFLDAMERLPEQAEKVLGYSDEIHELALHYKDSSNFLYIGRLYEYPVALEGALKLKEISYIHAEGIPAAELKHGPIALVDRQMPTVVSAAQQGFISKMMSNIREVKARGGRIIAVTTEGNQEMPQLAEHTVFIPNTLDPLVPILAVIPLQLLAYHMAVERGCDVDRPRNLAKSVTVE